MNENPCPQYPTPAITLEAYNRLAGNFSRGVKEVEYSDKRVMYHSVDDMLKILKWMEGILFTSCNSGAPMRIGTTYESGLNYGGYGEETEENFRYR